MVSLRQFGVCALVQAALLGCGQTTMHMNHSLAPHSPDSKPTANCQNVDPQIYAALRAKNTQITTKPISLAAGTCADMATIPYGSNLKDILGALQATSKSYTYFKLNTLPVNVWVDQPADTFKDASGKAIDTTPSDEDCKAAASDLAELFKTATVQIATDKHPAVAARRCYVDISFLGTPAGSGGDSQFEDFLAWTNPTAVKNHEPFHYYVTTGGVTHIVYIHAISTVPQN